MSTQETVESTGKTITISSVLALLDQGKSRKEIAEYFGETMAAMKEFVWSDPKLKNRKAKKQHNIVLVDDIAQEEANLAQDSDAILTVHEPAVEETTTLVDDTDSQEAELAQADVEAETTEEAPLAENVEAPVATASEPQRGSW